MNVYVNTHAVVAIVVESLKMLGESFIHTLKYREETKRVTKPFKTCPARRHGSSQVKGEWLKKKHVDYCTGFWHDLTSSL